VLLGLGLKENVIGVPMHHLVHWRISCSTAGITDKDTSRTEPPRQGRKDGGANPIHGEGPSTENQRGRDTLFSTHDYIPLALETKEEEDGSGAIEGSGKSAPSTSLLARVGSKNSLAS